MNIKKIMSLVFLILFISNSPLIGYYYGYHNGDEERFKHLVAEKSNRYHVKQSTTNPVIIARANRIKNSSVYSGQKKTQESAPEYGKFTQKDMLNNLRAGIFVGAMYGGFIFGWLGYNIAKKGY